MVLSLTESGIRARFLCFLCGGCAPAMTTALSVPYEASSPISSQLVLHKYHRPEIHRSMPSHRHTKKKRANMAVKVYGWAVSPFMARVLVCPEEVGEEYEVVPMSPYAGDHKRPDHLARNPFGQIPVLEDGDLKLYESRAIARYVLRKHKSDLLKEGRSLEESAMVDVWLEVEAHQHQPVVLAIVLHCIAYPLLGQARDQSVVDENVEKLKKILDVYEARLSQVKYLAGDFISLADLSHFPAMHYFMATEYASMVEAYPHVKSWWEGLRTRPSAKKVATTFMSTE